MTRGVRSAVSLLVRSFLLSVRMDGFGATIRRGWARLFGEESWCVFVRHLQPPKTQVEFPFEKNGMTIRRMTESDVDAVATAMPFDLDRQPLPERRVRLRQRLPGAVVATRDGRVVAAVFYTEAVNEQQPWYPAVAPHLVPPARFTANIFALPDARGAAWAVAKHGNDWLAACGVRTVVGLIRSDNAPSILVSRLLGSKIVARRSDRYLFGWRRTTIEAATESRKSDPPPAP
jgi:hypothetical protein